MQVRKTKIICTIGPASWDIEVIGQLIKAGMDLARLNFSHGTYQEKAEQIKNIRAASKKLNKPIGIIADLAGLKLRLGTFAGQANGKDIPVVLNTGEIIQLAKNPVGNEIPIQFDLSPYLKTGQKVLLNDGLVETEVLQIKGRVIFARVSNKGFISSNKGINVPDLNLKRAFLTEKDVGDAKFALKEGVDFLALSFVQSAKDLGVVRALIKKNKSETKIIAKLEKPKAIEKLEEIIKAADAVMIARGDLGIETEAARVPLLQKKIIRLSRQHFKMVIVASQMLESMTENPRPTRAEVSDVANAVFDQADAVMLSAETANGKYPVESVKMMASIIQSVESDEEYNFLLEKNILNV
ncbi:pyruvate kinase [Candidatus Daviesbacteria bacterium]|nr:pyruvate kinase [Candidatus Daviesbacteria bacterium]